MSKVKAWFYRNDKDKCKQCGNKLKKYEKEYYEFFCEKCESKNHRQMNR